MKGESAIRESIVSPDTHKFIWMTFLDSCYESVITRLLICVRGRLYSIVAKNISRIVSRDARITRRRSPPRKSFRARIEPRRIHCRFHGSSAIQRAAEDLHKSPVLLRCNRGRILSRLLPWSRMPGCIFARTGLRVMSEPASMASLRVRIFVQLCVTSGHYRVSRRGSLPDLSPYVVEQNDFEYPRVS